MTGSPDHPEPGEGRAGAAPAPRLRRPRDLAVALLTAAIVYGLIALGQSLHLVDRVQDDGADGFMTLFRPQLLRLDGQTPFALIDVDEQTHARWGEPLPTPRERLACLINFARTSGARLVLVDFDLSHASSAEGPTAGDGVLRRALTEGPGAGPCGAGEARPAPLLLNRLISSGYQDPRTAIGRIRPSFLDGANFAPGVHWASSTFLRSPDGVVRRWLLWDAGCRLDAPVPTVQAVPSMALATLALLDGKTPQHPEALARDIEGGCGLGNCLQPPPRGAGACPVARIGGWPVDLNTTDGRILFSFGWQGGRPGSEDRIPVQTEGGIVLEPFVRHVSAGRIIDLFCSERPGAWACGTRPREADVAPGVHLLEGRIVVIGASFADTRDAYQTPLGEMPGALIIINAVHSILSRGVPAQPPIWQRTLLHGGQAVILALVFFLVRSQWLASTLAFTLLTTGTFGLSRWVLRNDAWAEASVATFAIFLFLLLLPRVRTMFEWMIDVAPARHRRRSLRCLALAAALLSQVTLEGGLPAHAAGAQPAQAVQPVQPRPAAPAPVPALFGTVVGYQQPASAYRIVREGQGELPVRPMMDIVTGDRILVLSDQGRLTLERLDGRRVEFLRQHSGSVIPRAEATAAPSVPLGAWGRRMLETAGVFVQAWWDDGPTRITAAARGLGEGALRLPLLQGREARIAAGDRMLSIPWTGGAPPFRAQVRRADGGATVLAADDLGGRSLPPALVALRPGRYDVEVRDGAGGVSRAAFQVVSPRSVPEPPPDPGLASLPADVRTVAVAGWLAGRGEGEFALEGFLRVEPLAERYPPARGLRDGLAAGKRPQP